MKTSYVSFLVIIIASLLTGCVGVPDNGRPVVIGRPILPEEPGFESQPARNIGIPEKCNVLGLTFRGVGDTVTVSNNSRMRICILEGPVWMPSSSTYSVMLQNVVNTSITTSARIHIYVPDVICDKTGKRGVTIVSPPYYMTQTYSGYVQLNHYELVITDQMILTWAQGNGYAW